MSTKIFEGKLIELDTELDETPYATSAEIRYRKPKSGRTGTWVATIDGTLLKYQCNATDIDEYGQWELETHIIYNGLPYTGKTYLWQVERTVIAPR